MAKESKSVPPNNSFYTTEFSNYHPDRIRDLCGQSCRTCSMPYWLNLGSHEQCALTCCSCSNMGPLMLTRGNLGQYGLSCCSCSMMDHWGFADNPGRCVQLHCSGSTYPGPPCIHVQNAQSGCICNISVGLHAVHILHHRQILLLDIL